MVPPLQAKTKFFAPCSLVWYLTAKLNA